MTDRRQGERRHIERRRPVERRLRCRRSGLDRRLVVRAMAFPDRRSVTRRGPERRSADRRGVGPGNDLERVAP